jgi:hypothetical protein
MESPQPATLKVGTRLTVVPQDYSQRLEAVVERDGIRVLNKDYIVGLVAPSQFFSDIAFWTPYYLQEHRLVRRAVPQYVRIKVPGNRRRTILERTDPRPTTIVA